MKKNWVAIALGALAVVAAVVGVVIYKTTTDTAQQFQASIDQASKGAAGINGLAGRINNVLGSLGVGN